MDVLYYAETCPWSTSLREKLAQHNLLDKMSLVDVLQHHQSIPAGVKVVPSVRFRDGSVLQGQQVFDWVNSQESTGVMDNYEFDKDGLYFSSINDNESMRSDDFTFITDNHVSHSPGTHEPSDAVSNPGLDRMVAQRDTEIPGPIHRVG